MLGPRAKAVSVALQLFYLTGSCIGYLIIMRDQIKPVLAFHFGQASHMVDPWVLIPLVTW